MVFSFSGKRSVGKGGRGIVATDILSWQERKRKGKLLVHGERLGKPMGEQRVRTRQDKERGD